jgi:Tfp pilus assembly protein PilV
MHSAPRPRRSGLSLVEILVAMTIFITSFLALLGVFPTALHSVQQAREMNIATFLAEERLEQLKAFGSSSSTNFNTLASEPSASPIPITFTTNGQNARIDFQCQAQVAPSPSASPTMKQIQVTVSWFSRRQTGTNADLKTVRMASEILAP